MKIKSLLIIWGIAQLAFSQNSVVSFPTPEATSLGKYGQVPVSYFNGLPQISIPIYNIKCKDIELPVSLSYHASGNKPDEHPGWVGLGWNLNCGGMITRIVNGIRDETDRNYDQRYGNTYTFDAGYYYRTYEFAIDNWTSSLLPKMISNDESYTLLDTEPDEFIFNFQGHSGSFYFVYNNGIDVKVKSKDGEILKVDVLMTPDDLEFPVFDNSLIGDKYDYVYQLQKTFYKFIVTTRDGYLYEFGGDLSKMDFSTNSGVTMPTSWHLSKITSPSGSYIDFEYIKGGDVFVQHKSNYRNTIHSPQDLTNFLDYSDNSSIGGRSISLIYPKYLSKITTSNGQILNFYTSKTDELDYNWNDGFNYSTLLPGLLSGVCNSNTNDCYFDMNNDFKTVSYYLKLDRIEIDGVKNMNFFYNNETNERLKLQGVSTTDIYSTVEYPIDFNNEINKEKYVFSYNSTPLPAYNSRKTDNWGFYNNKDYSTISYSNYNSMYDFRTPDETYCKADILEKITYPTGGYTEFEFELNDYSKIVSKSANNLVFSLQSVVGNAGGLRVKAIKSYYDPNNPLKKLVKTYSYKNVDNTSSGILSGIPTYYLTGKKHIEYHLSDWFGFLYWSANASYDIIYNKYSQNLLLPLSTTNGNHVTYSRVVEQESDGSKIISTYTNHDEFPDEVPLKVNRNIGENYITSFTSKELERGLLKKTEIYNSYNVRIQETNYIYNDDANRYNNFVKTINRYTNSFWVNSNIINLYRFSANKIYTFYPYIKTVTETNYNNNGENPITTTTNYKYNAQYNILKEKETFDSRNEVLTTKFLYPFEFSTVNSAPSHVNSIMTLKNMLNYPLEEKTVKNNKVINVAVNTYRTIVTNDIVMPWKKYILNSDIPEQDRTFVMPILNTDLYVVDPKMSCIESYDFYDDGNLKEFDDVKKQNKIIYLWSYGNQYPVAKIVNATFSEVENAVKTNFSVTSVDALSAQWLPNEAKLKDGSLQAALPNAVVTTYTYKYFIGINTITDPRRVTTYYEYDPFNRLKCIKDKDNKILQSFDYNYKH